MTMIVFIIAFVVVLLVIVLACRKAREFWRIVLRWHR